MVTSYFGISWGKMTSMRYKKHSVMKIYLTRDEDSIEFSFFKPFVSLSQLKFRFNMT